MSRIACWRAPFLLCIFGTMTVLATPAQRFETLLSFDYTDGYDPFAGLVQASDGDFYGTTLSGGANTTCNNGIGCGTVFKITAAGTLTTLYSFCAQMACADGYNPGGLVQASDGNFYGTTEEGGADGYGTIFEITPAGILTILHSFNGTDGSLWRRYHVTNNSRVEGTEGTNAGAASASTKEESCDELHWHLS